MGTGTSAYGKVIRQAVKSAEDRIRNYALEYAVVFDSKGNKVEERTDYQSNSVNVQLAKMWDNIFTHNHPSGWCFSPEDIYSAVVGQVREMRACHPNGAYILTKNYKTGSSVPFHYTEFAKDYESAADNYKSTVVDPMWNSIRDKTQADADRCNKMMNDFRRDWLRNNAQHYGWTYKEGKRS